MNITDEETERFLNLVQPEYRRDVTNILSNMHASAIRTNIQIEGSNDGYYDNFITVTGKNYNTSDFKVIRLNPTFAQFKKDDAAFIIDFNSRRFDKLKLAFSSSVAHVFVEDINVMRAVACFAYGTNEFEVIMYSNAIDYGTLYFSENNANVSDYMWNIILNNRDNVNCMMSAYVSGATYSASDNIKKRIKALYESLSDSDKLLLELGEKI